MKEHVQKTGVRKYAGDDLIELQAEPLKAIQRFFEECGMCVIQGCEVAPVGNLYNVASGVVALFGADAEGNDAFKVVPFSGVENVSLPIYLTLTHTVFERAYADQKVKPIAYNYTAVASGVRPAGGVPFLEVTATGGKKFVDAIKVTEKLDKVGNGKDVTVTFSEAPTRENVASGEKLSVLFGKVRKWFANLGSLAFKNAVSKSDLDSALQTEINNKLGNIGNQQITGSGNVLTLDSDTNVLFDLRVNNISKGYLGLGRSDSQNMLLTATNGDIEFITNNKVLSNGNEIVTTNDVRLSDARPANGGNSTTVGDGTMTIVPFSSNGINFGGTGNYSTIYIGHSAIDSKPIPTEFIMGGETGTATIKAGNFLLAGKQVATINQIPTTLPASDVYAWAKQANKPGYTAAEVGAEAAFAKNTAFNKAFGSAAGTVCQGNDARLSDARLPTAHSHPASQVTEDTNRRFVSDAEKNAWNAKADGNHHHDSVYLKQNGDGQNVTAAFTQATSRTNIASGEKLSSIFGKVNRWFTDLKTVAFTGSAADITEQVNKRFMTDAERTKLTGSLEVICAGRINWNGEKTIFKGSFSVIYEGEGRYSVYHYLGSIDYSVMITVVDTGGQLAYACMDNRSSNSFRVLTARNNIAYAVNTFFVMYKL